MYVYVRLHYIQSHCIILYYRASHWIALGQYIHHVGMVWCGRSYRNFWQFNTETYPGRLSPKTSMIIFAKTKQNQNSNPILVSPIKCKDLRNVFTKKNCRLRFVDLMFETNDDNRFFVRMASDSYVNGSAGVDVPNRSCRPTVCSVHCINQPECAAFNVRQKDTGGCFCQLLGAAAADGSPLGVCVEPGASYWKWFSVN